MSSSATSFDETDIDKLATLARIRITPEERAGLAKDIESVLTYVSQLDSATPEGMERQKEPLRNVTRVDAVSHASGSHTQALLSSAPSSADGYVVVKKVL